MTIDTLKVAKRLREAGFTEPQAEAVVAAVQEGTEGAELATKLEISELKSEIAGLRAELETEIAGLRTELKTEIAALRTELKADIREAELRLEAKIEAMKAELLNRGFSMILGTLVVNIIAIVGAIFAVAKLLGH
jgi:DNA-binding transcriptional MerR regulator